jgi:ATP-binding cassette subfamily B multidrug efflux pump
MLDKIKWLWSFYRKYGYILAVLLILTPMQSALLATMPMMISYTVDYLKTGTIPDSWAAVLVTDIGAGFGLAPVMSFGLVFIIMGVVATSVYAFVQSHRAWMNLKLEWLFRQRAFDRITAKGPDFFNRFRTGDLITRMTDDVAEKLSWFACSGIFRLYEALIMVIFIIIMMISLDPWLTLWSAGSLPVLILIFFKTSSLLDKRYDHLQKKISDFNNIMEACYSGIRVVKAYVRENAQKDQFKSTALDRRSAEIDAIRITTVVDSLYQYIWQFGIIIVLVTGGYMLINGHLTEGTLAVFIYYVVWLVFPMFDIGQFLVKSRQSAVSINRLVELEVVPPMVDDAGDRDGDGTVQGALSFENVEFGFPGSERMIIDGLSLEIPAGQTIAIVGKVGSGKSWLLKMLPRLVDPTGGRVKLDGHDLRKFRLEDLRRNIGYVPQEPVLFSDTVRNNIVFGREDISEALLNWAIDVAQLRTEIASFPKGLDTSIGTRGMSISGGQKQRLGLARALVGKPRILILDDCTSALDSSTEADLWDRLHEVMPDLTAILVTHRPDTLEQADMIYLLEEGKVAEKGRHDQLMAAEGQYQKIYRRFVLEEQVK